MNKNNIYKNETKVYYFPIFALLCDKSHNNKIMKAISSEVKTNSMACMMCMFNNRFIAEG